MKITVGDISFWQSIVLSVAGILLLLSVIVSDYFRNNRRM